MVSKAMLADSLDLFQRSGECDLSSALCKKNTLRDILNPNFGSKEPKRN